MKQKIIFLDIDGVLNGYNFWTLIGWKIVSLLNVGKNWYRKVTNPCGVHEEKVKRLAKIIKETGAKVVMSSSWRKVWWKKPYEEMSERQKQLTDLLNKYGIEIIDITPTSRRGRREDEIISWLARHEDEIESFVILDDERRDLQCFVDDRLVQTSSAKGSQMIKGHWREDTGLKEKHVRQAIAILNEYTI
jgi:hypothetical protein